MRSETQFIDGQWDVGGANGGGSDAINSEKNKKKNINNSHCVVYNNRCSRYSCPNSYMQKSIVQQIQKYHHHHHHHQIQQELNDNAFYIDLLSAKCCQLSLVPQR